MDLYNPERHLVYTGPVWRKVRSDKGFSSDKWQEVTANLLDNYCKSLLTMRGPIHNLTTALVILCRESRWPNGTIKKVIMSRVSDAPAYV